MERQELWCHDCRNYVQFELDMSLDGNHVLECPKCGHEHCRVVRGGRITGERWDQRNGNTYYAYSTTYSQNSFYNTASATSSSTHLGASWFQYYGGYGNTGGTWGSVGANTA